LAPFHPLPSPCLNAAVDVRWRRRIRFGMLQAVNAILADRLMRAECVLVGVRVAG
jgi:hypothetical protein